MREREERKGTKCSRCTESIACCCSPTDVLSACVPQLDLEVVPSCACRQKYRDVAETLIRQALVCRTEEEPWSVS